jgi:hypothetical protein
VSAPDRVELIRLSSTLTGIDFVQVSPDQLELFVFIHHLSLPAGLANALKTIKPAQVEINGVGQVTPVHVKVTQHVLPIVSVNGRTPCISRSTARRLRLLPAENRPPGNRQLFQQRICSRSRPIVRASSIARRRSTNVRTMRSSTFPSITARAIFGASGKR